jgi:hypothetical protein
MWGWRRSTQRAARQLSWGGARNTRVGGTCGGQRLGCHAPAAGVLVELGAQAPAHQQPASSANAVLHNPLDGGGGGRHAHRTCGRWLLCEAFAWGACAGWLRGLVWCTVRTLQVSGAGCAHVSGTHPTPPYPTNTNTRTHTHRGKTRHTCADADRLEQAAGRQADGEPARDVCWHGGQLVRQVVICHTCGVPSGQEQALR